MARQPALALDRFDHRRLFTADIGAGAAAQVQLGVRRQPGVGELVDLLEQHQPQLGIFVTNVDVGVVRLDHPGGDQHAFEEAVRIAFEVIAVLEGAGLAFVGIDREQARRGLGAHQRPLATGREAGAAEAAQAAVADDLDEVLRRALAGETVLEDGVAALLLIGGKIDLRLPGMRVRVGLHRRGDIVRIGLEGLHMTDGDDRRAVAGAHAWRAHDAHILAEDLRQLLDQRLGADHRARN